jgi:DNA-directed RNA polymerase specialized sigma24 family protein
LPGWTTSAGPAASRPGSTSSRFSRPPWSCANAPGRAAKSPLEQESWDLLSSAGLGPADAAEQSELLAALQDGISALTPHQRRVLVALAVNGVPIDVLADRLNTNRGALYKTLHDARRNLRTYLTNRGLDPLVSFEEN